MTPVRAAVTLSLVPGPGRAVPHRRPRRSVPHETRTGRQDAIARATLTAEAGRRGVRLVPPLCYVPAHVALGAFRAGGWTCCRCTHKNDLSLALGKPGALPKVVCEACMQRPSGARSDLVCADCQRPMTLRRRRGRFFYRCTGTPKCRATHGAHPDGSPMGVPATAAVRRLRTEVHRAMEATQAALHWSRDELYARLARHLALTPEGCHVALFDGATCERALGYLQDEVLRTLDEIPLVVLGV